MNNEQLYNNIWEKAYWSAFAIINNASDAEDIAQISAIKFYLKKAVIEKSQAIYELNISKNEMLKKLKPLKKGSLQENAKEVNGKTYIFLK